MTDEHITGRIDMRVLDVHDSAARTDAVVSAVLSRIAAVRGIEELAGLFALRRRLLVAAAILAVVASTAVLATSSDRTPAPPADTVEAWAESGYVPTNGELLALYGGYGQ